MASFRSVKIIVLMSVVIGMPVFVVALIIAEKAIGFLESL